MITFYLPKNPYYEFSNYNDRYPFILDGHRWLTVEQYFQAQKFNIPDSPTHMKYYEIIKHTDTPNKAMMLGQQKCKWGYASKWVVSKQNDGRTVNEVIHEYSDLSIRGDWESIKLSIMKKGLYEKFTQHPFLKKLLLETGDQEIVENSPRDSYWGIGKNGLGHNHLGRLLMDIRKEIKFHPPGIEPGTHR